MSIQSHQHHEHGHDHDHDHPHEHQDHVHHGGLRGRIQGLFQPHSHDHGDLAADRAFVDNESGIRTVWFALVALAVTAVLQVAIVLASGSVALLADTAHNIGDGLNSIPLLVAFYLARRAATRSFTYGYGRAEDIAGIFIVLSILVSAGIVFWESFQRLLNPQPLANIGWVAAAAIIGFLGNEIVAIMQIRVGKRIDSAALIADGLHARTDGLTSLAVLVAAAGSWLGYPMVDPIIGLLIGLAILFITWDAGKRMGYRLMDAVDPALVDQVETTVLSHPLVHSVPQLRLRWIGHQLQGDMKLVLKPSAAAQEAKHELHHLITHGLPKLTDFTIEVISGDEQ